MAASDNLNKALFHSSTVAPDQLMKAPLIHVGTQRAARDIQDNREVSSRITKFYPSQHAEVHPEVLSDEEANEAHRQFVEARNYPLHLTVKHSALPRRSVDDHADGTVPAYETDAQKRRIQAAVQALSENKILQYENFAEDSGSLSYVVPSPHMNLRRKGGRDPMKQPVLPMDYSGVAPSNKTLAYRYGMNWEDVG